MKNESEPAYRFPRLSVRGLIVLILLAALGLGWYSSQRAAEDQRRLYEQKLRYADEELRRVQYLLEERMRGPRPDRNRSFWEAGLEGSNLKGMTIASTENAFQKASFRECDLVDAVLEGGTSAFQRACFDKAKLMRARLTGGGAAFQASTFVGADLTEATLTGGTGSFQGASFEKAILVRSTLSGSVQAVNLSGARFEGANLSAIAADDLASCYFKDPPTYDAETRFPPGFDPLEHLWRRVK